MTEPTTQPEALRIAQAVQDMNCVMPEEIINALRNQHAEIERLKLHIKHIGNDALQTENQTLAADNEIKRILLGDATTQINTLLADQLQAYGLQCAAHARELAAHVAKTTCHHEATEFANGFNMAALNIESAIEALKGK